MAVPANRPENPTLPRWKTQSPFPLRKSSVQGRASLRTFEGRTWKTTAFGDCLLIGSPHFKKFKRVPDSSSSTCGQCVASIFILLLSRPESLCASVHTHTISSQLILFTTSCQFVRIAHQRYHCHFSTLLRTIITFSEKLFEKEQFIDGVTSYVLRTSSEPDFVLSFFATFDT